MGLLRCYRTLLLCLHICRDTGVRGSHQAILTCTHRTILHAGKTAFAPADRGWQPAAGRRRVIGVVARPYRPRPGPRASLSNRLGRAVVDSAIPLYNSSGHLKTNYLVDKGRALGVSS